MKYTKTLLSSLLLACSLGAAAHQGAGHKDKPLSQEQKPWGIAGDAKTAKRTIVVTMSDQMRFTPDLVEVRQGETVKFVIRNAGKLLHEMVIGTREELDAHAALMLKFPGMEHDEPYMAHVAAGKAGRACCFATGNQRSAGCLATGAGAGGLEPTTLGFGDRCSTN